MSGALERFRYCFQAHHPAATMVGSTIQYQLALSHASQRSMRRGWGFMGRLGKRLSRPFWFSNTTSRYRQ